MVRAVCCILTVRSKVGTEITAAAAATPPPIAIPPARQPKAPPWACNGLGFIRKTEGAIKASMRISATCFFISINFIY